MQFISLDFMFFFPVVLAIYFIIPKKIRMYWLLVASYYFYMSWNPTYAFLILGSTVITYISAILFSRYNDKNSLIKKRATMIFCIVINLGILAYYNIFMVNNPYSQ